MIVGKLTKNNLNLLDEIATLFDQYRIFYGQNSDLEAAKEFLQNRTISEESQIFFIKDAEKIAGFTQIYYGFSSVSMRKICILNDLYIDKNYRKKGFAKALIKEVQQFCREKNLTKITLMTGKNNKQAQNLYDLEGFKKDEDFFMYNLELGQKST